MLIARVEQRAWCFLVTKNPPLAGEHWGNARGTNNGSHGSAGTGCSANYAANSHCAYGLGGGRRRGSGGHYL